MSTHNKISPESPKKTHDKSTHPRGRLSISPVECTKKHARLHDTDTDTDTDTTYTDTTYTINAHQKKRIKTSQDLCGND